METFIGGAVPVFTLQQQQWWLETYTNTNCYCALQLIRILWPKKKIAMTVLTLIITGAAVNTVQD
jgi:lipoprotein signal peptidase